MPPHEAPPLQFGLRAMFYVLAAVSGWLAVGVWFGPCGLVFVPMAVAFVVWLARSNATSREKGCASIFFLTVGVALLVALQPPQRRETGTRTECSNHLYNLGMALRAYHDSYGSFPPAYVADADGKPMHSWRVLLLPYLERPDLYRRYNVNEPWDAPNNRLLANEVIEIFHCPADHESKPGETSYAALVGPRTMWPGQASAGLDDLPDGSQNTLLLVEVANSGIHWMEPRDLDASALKMGINPAKGKGISSGHVAAVMVLFADGHVRFLGEHLDNEALEALSTRDGGEAIGEESLQ